MFCSTAVTVLEELYGVRARAEDFIPFAGMGEANFLGGVARKYGKEIDIAATKRRFFEIYLAQAADPDYRIGYPGKELASACRIGVTKGENEYHMDPSHQALLQS